jgi:hypothetical protein
MCDSRKHSENQLADVHKLIHELDQDFENSEKTWKELLGIQASSEDDFAASHQWHFDQSDDDIYGNVEIYLTDKLYHGEGYDG